LKPTNQHQLLPVAASDYAATVPPSSVMNSRREWPSKGNPRFPS